MYIYSIVLYCVSDRNKRACVQIRVLDEWEVGYDPFCGYILTSVLDHLLEYALHCVSSIFIPPPLFSHTPVLWSCLVHFQTEQNFSFFEVL